MTSTVLARKHRPRSFEAMVGQGHVVQALANALTQQRLHHAYLFTGTRGVGKTTVSRILAKSLNCVGPDGQGGITATPCGQCQPCLDIDAGRFVDYVELDAASNRGVDEISQLLDQSVYKPVVGRFKVYMIDEVHMLTNTAFNAMLKTLEEPPDYLKFVLATTDPQKVPVTVLSRCLQFNLRPMDMQTVQEHLDRVLTQEGISFEPAALRWLARAARGSMRDGLSLTDQAIAYGAGVLQEAVVRQMLGAVDREHVLRILGAAADGDGPALVDTVNGLRKLGLSAHGTLDELALALQQMALLQTVPSMVQEDLDASTWTALAQRMAPDETQLFYSLALHGRQEIALAPDEYAGLLMILLRWLAFKPGAGAQGQPRLEAAIAGSVAPPKAEGPAARAAAGPAQRQATAAPVVVPVALPLVVTPSAPDPRPEPPPWDDIEPVVCPEAQSDAPDAHASQMLSFGPVPSLAMASEPLPDAPALLTTRLGDRWADVVERLVQAGLVAALVRELAMQAECVAVNDAPGLSVWRLRVERENLRSDAQRERLRSAVQQALGGEVQIDLEAGIAKDTPALRDQVARANKQAAAQALIKQDPLVRSLLEQFPGAKVLPGSITVF